MQNEVFDSIIIGSGMGGLSAASSLCAAGYKVLVLEKAAIPGGCSSSYKRMGAVYESGATTLIGFDHNQPMRRLEEITGIRIPREALDVSMRIEMDGKRIDRSRNLDAFISQSVQMFGNEEQQGAFWAKCMELAELVWDVSSRNTYFPPKRLGEWIKTIFANNPMHVPALKYLFKSTQQVIDSYGLNIPEFKRFVDEQLMITAQATSEEVPFLFAAPALTYPHYTNFYVPGGLWNMAYACTDYIESNGGQVNLRAEVLGVDWNKKQAIYEVLLRRKSFKTKNVIFNIPVWNISEIVKEQNHQTHFRNEAKKFDRAWGAFTIGVLFEDKLPDTLPLHHQVHYTDYTGQPASIFISLSKRGDDARAPIGKRTANISTHTEPNQWFDLDRSDYDQLKSAQTAHIMERVKAYLKLQNDDVIHVHPATPRTWQHWVGRAKGKVGGLPQSMSRNVLSWPDANPFPGMYLCGDTVFPGQGIPGVTLSGLSVYSRILNNKQ